MLLGLELTLVEVVKVGMVQSSKATQPVLGAVREEAGHEFDPGIRESSLEPCDLLPRPGLPLGERVLEVRQLGDAWPYLLIRSP